MATNTAHDTTISAVTVDANSTYDTSIIIYVAKANDATTIIARTARPAADTACVIAATHLWTNTSTYVFNATGIAAISTVVLPITGTVETLSRGIATGGTTRPGTHTPTWLLAGLLNLVDSTARHSGSRVGIRFAALPELISNLATQSGHDQSG